MSRLSHCMTCACTISRSDQPQHSPLSRRWGSSQETVLSSLVKCTLQAMGALNHRHKRKWARSHAQHTALLSCHLRCSLGSSSHAEGDPKTQAQRTAQHSTARHCTALHGTARHGMARHGTALHCTARHCTSFLVCCWLGHLFLPDCWPRMELPRADAFQLPFP